MQIQEEVEVSGSLDILNVAYGDIKFSFDKSDPEEVQRAKDAIATMRKSGFAILVEVDGELQAISDFDPETECYVIAEKGTKTKKKIPMKKAKATGIPAVAGG